METSEEVRTLVAKVDSIQARFMESLITGRNVLFQESEAKRKPGIVAVFDAHVDSQRGTF
jgi:hypothetical protein